MKIGSFNYNKEKFEKMQRESNDKGYNTSYCKVEIKQDPRKTLLGLASIGILSYMGYKYVIKPIAQTLRQVLNVDEIKEGEQKEKESRINKNTERIFNGIINKDAVDVEFTVVDV